MSAARIKASGIVRMQTLYIPLSLFVCLFFLEELSDEYQTDYDEEAVESALSDYEAFNHGSEHTEGEETVDTVETVRQRHFTSKVSQAEWKGDSNIISLSFTG